MVTIVRIEEDLSFRKYRKMREAHSLGNGAVIVKNEKELSDASKLSLSDMATIFNKLVPEDKQIKKFSDREAGSRRLWAALDELPHNEDDENSDQSQLDLGDGETKAPKVKKEKKERVKKERVKREPKERAPSSMDLKLTPIVTENPFRAESKSGKTYQMVLDNPGLTMRDYVRQGGRVNALRYSVQRKHFTAE